MYPAVQTSHSLLMSTIAADDAARMVRAYGYDGLILAEHNSLGSAYRVRAAARALGIACVHGLICDTKEGTLTLLATNRQGWNGLLAVHASIERARRRLNIDNILDRVREACQSHGSDGLWIVQGTADSALAQTLQQKGSHAMLLERMAEAVDGRLLLAVPLDQGLSKTSLAEYADIAQQHGLLPIAWKNVRTTVDRIPTLQIMEATRQQTTIPNVRDMTERPGIVMRTKEDVLAEHAGHRTLVENHEAFLSLVEPDAGPSPSKPMLPLWNSKTSEQADDADQELRRRAREGLERLLAHKSRENQERYRQRLETEIAVITRMGFTGYFLIVAEFVGWAKANGIRVGPGRGSGAGSLTAHCLGITALDPVEHGLLFERFINPDRVSLPDFDIDFEPEGRERVIAHVKSLYGEDAVLAIGTEGTWGARSAIRDAGRAHGLPLGLVNDLATSIGNADSYDASNLPETTEEIIRGREEIRTILAHAQPLQGLVRHHGRHAAGIVIANMPIASIVPVMQDPGGTGEMITQFDMKDCESCGLVKFDFLGLKTLTIIDRSIALARDAMTRFPALFRNAPPIPDDMDRVDIRDAATMETIRKGWCHGLFQLESEGMVKALLSVHPDRFEDIIAIISLYRPGPMQFVEEYAARKKGLRTIAIPHPKLKEILEETYGIPIYQEQIIEIAKIMAGYTAGQADILRRAMGKKIPEEMARMKATFIAGCLEQGYDDSLAQALWTMTERFAGYGFNKSHAASYALITWQTAWLKTHYPHAFYAAAIDAHADNPNKMNAIRREAEQRGIQFLPPLVGASDSLATIEGSASGSYRIRWGLANIKGIGHGMAERIAAATRRCDPSNTQDLAARLYQAGTQPSVIRALAEAGAFDAAFSDRQAAATGLIRMIEEMEQGVIGDLFARTPANNAIQSNSRNKEAARKKAARTNIAASNDPDTDSGKAAIEQAEYDRLGTSFHRHPAEAYADQLYRLECIRLSRIMEFAGCGLLHVLARIDRIDPGRRGSTITISDMDTSIPAQMPEGDHSLANTATGLLGELAIIGISVTTTGQVRAWTIEPVETRQNHRRVEITLRPVHDLPSIIGLLAASGRGTDRVDIRIETQRKSEPATDTEHAGERQAHHRKMMPSCFRVTDRVLDEILRRPDVASVRSF